uniref:Putative ovule protein n=1 Tax=Solanum chacoense TaxID=4108 RepID=A0A0V0HBQ9_SOLCH
MVLKEQIRVLSLEDSEMRFLEKVVLFESNSERFKAWENGSVAPQESLRAAQIEGISRRQASSFIFSS